jgi:hypothetical protein
VGKAEDLTGQKFGRWTVISQGPSTSGRETRWWCKCDCGNQELKLVRKNGLKNGTSRSCGCLQKEIASSIRKKHNEYNLSGEYGVGFTINYDSYGRNEFYFDLDDYEKIKDYCWYFNKRDYLQASDIHNDTQSTRKIVQLHQLVLPTDINHVPDHIHGESSKNDNRKENLREVTISQNAMNVKIRTNNTSGVTGVCWNKKSNKYRAYIQKDGKNHNLGFFVNFEDAVKARKEAELKYFGEYSYDSSQAM